MPSSADTGHLVVRDDRLSRGKRRDSSNPPYFAYSARTPEYWSLAFSPLPTIIIIDEIIALEV
jgi:hypothetical protein